MQQLPDDPPPSLAVLRRRRFSDHFLEQFIRAAVEWTRKHDPERLKDPESGHAGADFDHEFH